MKQKATVGGRSFFFNVIFVVLNLVGLTFVVLGAQKMFESYYLLFSFIGFTTMAIAAAGLFIFSGRLMMSNVSRVIVGSIFIVSGLVKANDPIGFSYKLEEYFEDGALAFRIKELFGAPGFSLEFLISSALFLSVVICIIEIVLGVLLIIGGKLKLVTWLSVFMMAFFTFLTWHTANCNPEKKFKDRNTYAFSDGSAQMKLSEIKTNKSIHIVSKTSSVLVVDEMMTPQCVSDCGCFGDAMKGSIGRSLTPSESLWKDLVLLYFLIWIFLAQWITEPNTSRQNLVFVSFSVVFMTFFSWLFSWYFIVFFGLMLVIAALWMKRIGGVILGNYLGSVVINSVMLLSVTTYVLMYEPLKDYRPYAIGKNLWKQMNDGVEGKYESTFVLRNVKTGKKEVYSQKEYLANENLWDTKKFKFLKGSQREIIPARLASITEQFDPFLAVKDLTPFDLAFDEVQKQLARKVKDREEPVNEISLRSYIAHVDQIVILSVKRLSDANWNEISSYRAIAKACKMRSIPFIMITNAAPNELRKFREKYGMHIPIFLNDETELKAISRSNPCLLVVRHGIVTGKFAHRSTPDVHWFLKNSIK
jgi:uncharacterized membrane protein YphA (DoxX/SURF4 family)